jgi:SAM-dependent methyltransferase
MYSFDDAEYKRMGRKYSWSYRDLLPSERDSSILDIGCGVGHFLKMLEDEGYTDCTGIDASTDAIEICRAKVRAEVHLADACSYLTDRLPSVDCIVSMHVIEHMNLPEARTFINLTLRALRPGGTLIVATPNADSPWAGHCMFDDLTHKRLYTPRTLRQLLTQSGFGMVSILAERPAPYDVPTFFRWFASAVLHLIRQVTFAIEIGPGRCLRSDMILTPGIIAVAKKKG